MSSGPVAARTVGYALAALRDGSDVPWQRIVNREGRISLPDVAGEVQRMRLQAEGVTFDTGGRIDLRRFGWSGTATRGRSPRRKSRRAQRRPPGY